MVLNINQSMGNVISRSLLLTSAIICLGASKAHAECPQEYRALVEKLFFEGFSGGNLQIVEEVFSPDIHFQDPVFPDGIEGIKALAAKNNRAMSDWAFIIKDMLCDSAKTAVRWSASGRHTGSFMGEEPTGNTVELNGIVIYEIHDNQITHDWLMSDNLGFLTQIGVLSHSKVNMSR